MGAVVAVLAVLIVGLSLIILKVVPILVGIALTVIGLFVVAAVVDRRDRGRQRGLRDLSRRLDVDRGIVPTDLDHDPYDQPVTYVDTQVASRLADDREPVDAPPA
jgi:hypothetical protein